MRRRTDIIQASQDASVNAYLDMALRDSGFGDVVKKIANKDLVYLKSLLAPERTEHSLVEPMKKFSDAINGVLTKNFGGKKREVLAVLTEELLQKLKL